MGGVWESGQGGPSVSVRQIRLLVCVWGGGGGVSVGTDVQWNVLRCCVVGAESNLHNSCFLKQQRKTGTAKFFVLFRSVHKYVHSNCNIFLFTVMGYIYMYVYTHVQ